ncbi:MAG: hypothetical protein HY550_00590 [Elusimicrobia bacterium]|nr:hypothetical protein [Elusimicrobiota bacterium]
MMRFLEKARLFSLFAALLTVLSLPAHEAFTHGLAESGCQICSVSHNPELNADCGSRLLSAPENFSLLSPSFLERPAAGVSQPAFLGRAPPATASIG